MDANSILRTAHKTTSTVLRFAVRAARKFVSKNKTSATPSKTAPMTDASSGTTFAPSESYAEYVRLVASDDRNYPDPHYTPRH